MFKLNEEIYRDGLASYAIRRGGRISPLVIPLDRDIVKECAIFNPSIINMGGRLLVNLRISNVLFYFVPTSAIPYTYGPLQYIHPENDVCLETRNYLCEVDSETLSIREYARIDTSMFDTDPLYGFHGMEDGRLVCWNGILYLTGCRRDDIDKDGTCRMNIQQIRYDDGIPVEVKRMRVPTPRDIPSYCEKNWMPFADRPFEYVRQTWPTETVKYDPERDACESVSTMPGIERPHLPDVRGSSQVIRFDDKNIALGHTTFLWKTANGMKDAAYRNHLLAWDKDMRLVGCSQPFKFLEEGTCFCCGVCRFNDDIIISFSREDNSAFLLSMPMRVMEDLLYDQE